MKVVLKAAILAFIISGAVSRGTRGAVPNRLRKLEEDDLSGLSFLDGLLELLTEFVEQALNSILDGAFPTTTVPVPLPEGETLNIPAQTIPTGLPGFNLLDLLGLDLDGALGDEGDEIPTTSITLDILGMNVSLPGESIPIPGPGITVSTPEGMEGADEEAPVAEGVPELGEAGVESLPLELPEIEGNGGEESDPESIFSSMAEEGVPELGEAGEESLPLELPEIEGDGGEESDPESIFSSILGDGLE